MTVGPTAVAVFIGFLGAGKTTVLQRVVSKIGAYEKVLMVVNDLSEHNIDVHFFSPADHAADGAQPAVRSLSGGCVCCNLLSELVEVVLRAHAERYSYIFLECTGVADPVPVVATLAALPALKGKIVMDAVIAVVHAESLRLATDEWSEKVNVANVDRMQGGQLQGANVVLINNWECVNDISPDTMHRWSRAVKEFVAPSNPGVRVCFTNSGHVAYAELIHRQRLFDEDNTLPFFLRAYGESGRKIGDAGDPNEEAKELSRLGLTHFAFESVGDVYSMRRLHEELSKPTGREFMRDIWRSKGFFTAVDNESEKGYERECQFRWQTVGHRIDYSEVLPPRVPLIAEADGTPLACRIVFIGSFDRVKKIKAVELFFGRCIS